MPETEPLKIYASRTKTGGLALTSAVLAALVMAVLNREQTRGTLVVGVCLFGLGFLLNLYWALTPSPLLSVDRARLEFQRWPFIRCTIAWADVASVTVIKNSYFMYGRHVTISIQVTLRPNAVAKHGDRQQLNLAMSQVLLPMPVEELVRRLRRYHKVTY